MRIKNVFILVVALIIVSIVIYLFKFTTLISDSVRAICCVTCVIVVVVDYYVTTMRKFDAIKNVLLGIDPNGEIIPKAEFNFLDSEFYMYSRIPKKAFYVCSTPNKDCVIKISSENLKSLSPLTKIQSEDNSVSTGYELNICYMDDNNDGRTFVIFSKNRELINKIDGYIQGMDVYIPLVNNGIISIGENANNTIS